MNFEQKLLQDLSQNEHIIHILPFDELKLEYEETKSALQKVAKNASAGGSSITAAKLIKEFGFKTDQVFVKTYKEKQYIIFKGYPGDRSIFRGTRYLKNNPKVVRMAVGPKGIVKSARVGFVLTTVLYVGIEVFDFFVRDTATLHETLGSISSEVIKIGVVSIASAVAGMAIGSATIISAPVAAPIIAAIAVGWITGHVLDKIDKKVGATKALIEAYRRLGLELSEIEYRTLRWYNYFQNNPAAVKQLFGGLRLPSVGGY